MIEGEARFHGGTPLIRALTMQKSISGNVKRSSLFVIIGPGILVAATGVGAGDLATGAFCGSKLGLAVLWAVLIGAGLKLLLNEGLARWQLATGTTPLEGCVAHLGRPVQWVFLAYLLIWSYFVGSALMSACGVAAHAILPMVDARSDKIIYGLLHSAAAVALVRLGGYRLFARVMGGCIALMFVVVIATAVAVKPCWSEVVAGLFRPSIPLWQGEGIQWTIALMGGVGGTLTVLCYGYWIREEGRTSPADLAVCRIDLAVAYAMTALFGIAMVTIGSTIKISGGGATLVVELADRLQATLGPAARWAFLAGAWGALFSSLLGVWQSVPYLFADFWQLMRAGSQGDVAKKTVDTRSLPYRAYLYVLATVPAVGLWTSFQQAQKVYAIVGALFIPMLALALLVLNGRARLVGDRYRNPIWVSCLLIATLVFFLLAAWFEIQNRLAG